MSHYSQNVKTKEQRENIERCKEKMSSYKGKHIRIVSHLSSENLKVWKG
jgi:hypothetical protein